mmetsp:Transcript_13411/g.28445  ORF Transcript_13411/g.28445 Transcript_13411/m.28445 type:complete len:279 (-) Transcript_13411:164-1000(-)
MTAYSFILTLLAVIVVGIRVFMGSKPWQELIWLETGDRKILTNIMTAGACVEGFLALAAQRLNLRLYRNRDDSLITKCFYGYIGAGILSVGSIGLGMFTLNMAPKKAIGCSSVIRAVTLVKELRNRVPRKLGISSAGHWLWFIIICVEIYAIAVDSSNAESLLIADFTLLMLTCVVAIVSPRVCAMMHGASERIINGEQTMWCRGVGFENLSLSVFALNLLNGIDPQQSLGYMSVPVIAHCVQLLVGDADLGKVGSTFVLSWAVFHGYSFVTLGLLAK